MIAPLLRMFFLSGDVSKPVRLSFRFEATRRAVNRGAVKTLPRRSRRGSVGCVRIGGVLLLALAPAVCVWAEDSPGGLPVQTGGYPRAFFFRQSEGLASNPRMSYDRWEAGFSRLMGIEGKALEEEIPGRSKRNIEFFTRFKKDNPDQLVLLHYNGNARDPRDQTEKFYAGHWLYHNGATILDDVPAEPGETTLRVSDPLLFHTEMGRYEWSNEDVGLCVLDAEGRPDWSRSEQVQLLAVDRKAGTICVRRGCYGTEPRAFAGGKAYAAAHVTEGPWGRKSNLLWYYNYATCCPRDAEGRVCADILADELAARFAADGELAAFDGLEFDVLHHRTRGTGRHRAADCDADGVGDRGVFEGVNQYGAGVVEFCRLLREKVGDGRILQADGAGVYSQRAFHLLNGIESEGWPVLNDWEIRDWSGGLNRHFFWQQNARPPVFNYINHKFTARGEKPGERVRPEVPFAVHRLVMAVAVCTDSAICYSYTPPKEPGELTGIWDELDKGTEDRVGWLGQPCGPAVRLAAAQPNLLAGKKQDAATAGLLDRLVGPGVRFEAAGTAIKATPTEAEAGKLAFMLRDVPCDGPDLFVQLVARAAPMRGYPKEVARLAWGGVARPKGRLLGAELPTLGMCLRGESEVDLDPESGASVRWIPSASLGDQTLPAYGMHPPYRGKPGYSFWCRDVEVPPAGRLEFLTGMGPKAPERSDGVVFQVVVAPLSSEGTPGPADTVFEHSQVASRWVEHRVDVSRYAGQHVRLKFVADCGPKDHTTTDHAYWGAVKLLGPEGDARWTEPVRYMTFLGSEEFCSGFYFSAVRSEKVDLEFEIEGGEPVWITRLTAHAAPDAMFREFEHGLVLANPSPRPFTFELAELLPGRSYRRLQGSPRQDPEANDGSAVGERVTLGPKEGLFLVGR